MFFHWLIGLFLFHFIRPPDRAMAPSAPKRCAWESKPNQPGVRLGSDDQIVPPTTLGSDWDHLHASLIHEGSIGIAFVTLPTLKLHKDLRSTGPLLCIVKGAQREALSAMGFEADRLEQSIISIIDCIQQTEEARCVTLVNMAASPDEFWSTPSPVDAIEVSSVDRSAIFAEIRADRASKEEWEQLQDPEAFSQYVKETVRSVTSISDCIFYKIHQKQGYMCQRIQVPFKSKFGLYKCSGLHSVQFRAVMEANSPPEKGLELIPLKGEPLILSKEFAKLASIEGHLGVFKTQHQTFFRVEDECLAAARQAIYGSDERFSDWNRDTKAIHMFKIQGFGSGTHFRELVAFSQEIGWKCVPHRVVNFQDLSVLFAFAEQPPDHPRYPSSRGTILITECEQRPNKIGRIQNSQQIVKKQSISAAKPAPKPAMKPVVPQSAKTHPPIVSQTFSAVLQTNPLAARVEILERQMREVKADVSEVKEAQLNTHHEVQQLSANQNQGFERLMDAIASLRAPSSASTTPIHSPPHKVAKGS